MKKFIIFIAVLAFFLPVGAEQIASIEVTSSWTYFYNAQGKKYKTFSNSSIGHVLGYSSNILVTQSSSGSWIYVYDSDGKKICTKSASTVGDVIGVAGDTFTSRNGSWIYTWSKDGNKISTRSAH